MIEYSFDLTVIWAVLISVAVVGYVVLDGFDLGIGMLFSAFPGRRDRDVMMNSIAPVWDGNETWLVLGGGGLLAAFPLAYAVILPALYLPVIVMLLALVFRGVAFEFRWRTTRWRGVWDVAFIAGSGIAAFAQGVTLGGLLQGIAIDDTGRAFAGGAFDFVSPFTFVTGIAVMIGYMLLGSTYLVMKTTEELQDKARRIAWIMGIGTVASIVLVSLFTPYLDAQYFDRWFTFPNILGAGLPVGGVAVPGAGAAGGGGRHLRPFQKPDGASPRIPAVSLFARALRPVAHWARSLDVALCRPDPHHHLGRGGARDQPEIHAGRRRHPPADHHCLYGLCLLGVSREGRS